MADVMVTGRMPEQRKAEGARVLKRAGMNASQAINLMYERLIADRNADFLKEGPVPAEQASLQAAAAFVDAIPCPRMDRFKAMSKQEIKMDRLRSRGLVE